jgi:salicylate hydroxylase
MTGWRILNVGVIGGGIGGLSAAIALRRAGHEVTIYERFDFVGEVGASVSCAANGTRWLQEWDVNIPSGDPVVLKKTHKPGLEDWRADQRLQSRRLGKPLGIRVLYVPSAVYACDVEAERLARIGSRDAD